MLMSLFYMIKTADLDFDAAKIAGDIMDQVK